MGEYSLAGQRKHFKSDEAFEAFLDVMLQLSMMGYQVDCGSAEPLLDEAQEVQEEIETFGDPGDVLHERRAELINRANTRVQARDIMLGGYLMERRAARKEQENGKKEGPQTKESA